MKPYIAIPATLLLVYRAWSRKSLTAVGILVAALTAVAHAIHPWSVFFALLAVFFLSGSSVTKVKHDVKSRLTISSSGSSGGEGPRTHIQVLANSGVASILILMHARQLYLREQVDASAAQCWPDRGDLLVVGIVANYAAVAADTFSSELGILSKSTPRLITSPTLRKVAPGTNGGVTLLGLLAGLLGAFIIAVTSTLLLPFCHVEGSILAGPVNNTQRDHTGSGWDTKSILGWTAAVTIWGGLGSLLDSFLGGWLQASVVDTRTGKVVEGDGGRMVLVTSSGPSSMHYNKSARIKGAIGRGEGPDSVGRTTAASTTDTTAHDTRRRAGVDATTPESHDHQGELGTPSRKVVAGFAFLDNNGVNVLMAAMMSIGAMIAASLWWDIPLTTIIR